MFLGSGFCKIKYHFQEQLLFTSGPPPPDHDKVEMWEATLEPSEKRYHPCNPQRPGRPLPTLTLWGRGSQTCWRLLSDHKHRNEKCVGKHASFGASGLGSRGRANVCKVWTCAALSQTFYAKTLKYERILEALRKACTLYIETYRPPYRALYRPL